ncbi:DNA recombination protein RmuC [Dyella acidiphila]|uniref:DNA recombination protein RmuC n=1 Tax=Dyella acidiphila TaxID=2775866 RepID=A0ABR9G8E8_9GAMM|nr:DNA recombination protein RmuC [Dyella acidiphila]MBE1160284.1 DNA recombination protein RmuC [Dyella acidiphila]
MPLIDLLLALTVLLLVLQVVLLLRGRGDGGLHARLDALKDDNRHLRDALAQEQRAGRGELSQALAQFRGLVQEQLDAMAAQQQERIGQFGQRLELLTERTDNGMQSLAQRLAEDARRGREELAATFARFGEQQQQRLSELTANSETRLGEVRSTLETRLSAMQQDNAAKLEQMRATVDEKLQATLETRLGHSFKLVSDRLEAVQRGLGEMQSLASGVGDLKRVLSNVKTRGILGEMQLSALLEQMLAPEQYASNVATVPGSDDRVEFAVRLPGSDRDHHVWLPIDAKFPSEDYERLLDAQQQADAEGVERAALALERHIREEAKTIRAKYIAPPATTDFAILFLPTEGLYAEIIRRPGLFESLQREQRVTIAGPTTLSALLNSLQMGFRTLAIQQRSSEVWQLLGAVKNEFGKFGDVLRMVRKKLDEAGKHIDATSVRTRAIERRLRDVESLPGEQAQQFLGDAIVGDEETTED